MGKPITHQNSAELYLEVRLYLTERKMKAEKNYNVYIVNKILLKEMGKFYEFKYDTSCGNHCF